MLSSRWCLVLCLASLACTPKINGTCDSNADCHPGESCSAGGLCLRPNEANDGGAAGDSSDAGDAGTPDSGPPDAGLVTSATIDIVSPAAGAFERGSFHVAAQTASAIAIQDVTFYLTNSASGVAAGQLIVSSPTVSTWSGDLTLNASSFGGSADLVAVMHRTGLTDVTSGKVSVVIDQNAPSISPSWNPAQWWALDAGISVTASATDDRSGVASATLILPDGGTVAGTIGTGTATFQLPATSVGMPGAAVRVPISLGATDRAGNSTLLVSASSIAVDNHPPAIALVALDPSIWRNGPLDVSANVSDGAGSGVGSSSLLLNAAFTSGAPDGGGGFNYHVNLSTLPATEAAVTLQALAVDMVGNQADAGFSINVDNVSPAISALQIDTAFDGTDAANQGWFAGPTAAPSATGIAVSAAIKDKNLVVTGTHRPVALVSGTPNYGTFNSNTNRWHFSIPRSVGLNANAPVRISFDAQDLAGNHPVSPPALSLQFDDTVASGFTPTVASDPGWYARGSAVSASVGATLLAVPRSGVRSVALRVPGQADVPCTGSGSGYSCKLPSTYAPAGAEAPLSLSVVATSTVGMTSSGVGSRNIDDVLPVISNAAAVPYPAAATGALAWSHDGTHFNMREGSINVYTFTTYDCGAGIKSLVSATLSPLPSGSSAALTATGGTVACASGRPNAALYNVAVSSDLSTTAAGSFANADSTLSISVKVSDAASDGGGGFPNIGSNSKNVAVTRRLWQTGAISAGSIAMGPVLIVAAPGGTIDALACADGSLVWTVNTFPLFSGPAVGGAAGSPTVYYGGLPSLKTDPSVFSLSAATGAAGLSCNARAFITRPSGCSSPPVNDTRISQFLSLATDGTAAVIEDDESDAQTSGAIDCGAEGYVGYRLGATCSNWIPDLTRQKSLSSIGFGNSASGLAIGRSGRAFYVDSARPQEISLSGGGITSGGVTCATTPIIADSGGNDAPVCYGQALLFNGGFSTVWSGSFTSPLAANGFLVANVSGNTQPFVLSNGSTSGLAGGSSRIPWAIDASSPPVVYLSNSGTLFAQQLTASGIGAAVWGLPPVPGTAITDLVMDKTGVLYVSSNGQVSAMVTDSPGLGTGNNGWPIRGHDACRSYNLEYACPY